MIVSAHNPETTQLEKTYLSQYTAAAAATLSVKNNEKFATSQAVLIGKMGHERSEIITTDGVTGQDTITIDGTTEFDHNADDPIYLLAYNQIKIYRATSIAGSYSSIATIDVDVDNQDRVTRYDDTGGLTTHFYKISYYNSISTEETELSDAIAATGYAAKTAGKVIDAVVRRVADTNFEILGIDEYLDIINEVNEDLLLQAQKPYGFLKKQVALNTVAAQNYISLTDNVPDFWKFNYLSYEWTVGGVTREYKIDTPLTREEFLRKYDNTNWQDNDELLDVALDDENNRILLGPAPKTSQSGVVNLFYWGMFDTVNSLGDVLQTPTTLIYRYKMMAEYYSAKAETDRQWFTLADKYENKYGNEVVKMQRANRRDSGTPRSFAPKKVPAMRKRYHL